MSELVAKPVVKNKFWVVENSGEKIATIQARHDGGYVYVHDDQREYFSTVRALKEAYNIKFGSLTKAPKESKNHVYGFPISGRAFNRVWDVQRKLPVYTKTLKSRSYFCAGYYLIKFNGTWSFAFCPKNITLSRYEFVGPFRTGDEAKQLVKELECTTI
jgi:hypothetical protein